jgi:hypothetical protein
MQKFAAKQGESRAQMATGQAFLVPRRVNVERMRSASFIFVRMLICSARP